MGRAGAERYRELLGDPKLITGDVLSGKLTYLPALQTATSYLVRGGCQGVPFSWLHYKTLHNALREHGPRFTTGSYPVYPRDDGRSDTMVVGLVDGRLMTLKTLFIQGMSGK